MSFLNVSSKALMHAADLVDLAGFISTHSKLIIRDHSEWAPIATEQYWATSRCRLDYWSRSLKLFHADVMKPQRVYSPWPAILPVAGEVLMSEMLARVWTAVSRIHDDAFGEDSYGAIADSVLVGHLEARNRVLKLIIEGDRSHQIEAANLNRLRKKIERWTDLLLGNLHNETANQFGFKPERVSEFAHDSHDLICTPESTSWHLLMSSLHQSFVEYREHRPINVELNEQIFASIMSCFPADLFESTGNYHSLWLVRIMYSADKTDRLIDGFLRSGLSISCAES